MEGDRGKKAQPRKAKSFSTCAFKSSITEKNKYESSSLAFANLWLLLVLAVFLTSVLHWREKASSFPTETEFVIGLVNNR